MKFTTTVALLCLVAAATAFPLQNTKKDGTHWALLIAGSNSWGNYRHQADIYHSYQIMKRNGLKDENIVVMHYDDIANNQENPKKGQVINKPDGSDVYQGVPKDYTGADVNAENFLAVLKGDSSAVNGKKVIASGPNDNVFVYYADHGGTGILGMPEGEAFLYGKDIVKALQDKAAAKGFNKLVFYLEACESGSIFEGTLPDNIEVYATTAANAQESSWGTYCPGMTPAPPAGYNTCLGDLYSVSWMENADQADLNRETLEKQYQLVAQRTSQNGSYSQGSHVMQFGQKDFDNEACADFMGTKFAQTDLNMSPAQEMTVQGAVEQRDASLVYYHTKYMTASGAEKAKALAMYNEQLDMRLRTDEVMTHIATAVGHSLEEVMEKSEKVSNWDCYKQSVASYTEVCGPLGQYGMKYGRALVNLCNAGVSSTQVLKAAEEACQ
jgi:legumain